jgi:large subunit ribosomal protein L30
MTVENNDASQAGGKQLKVTLLKSPIRSRGNHKDTIKSLGLHHINDSHTLPDTPAVRGMISAVKQWVKFEEV